LQDFGIQSLLGKKELRNGRGYVRIKNFDKAREPRKGRKNL
jgi:hypothetical protein